jgi:hypothetical protein
MTNEVAPYSTGTKQTNRTTILKDKDLTPILSKKSTKLRHVKTNKERKKTRTNETDEIDEMKQVSCFRTYVPSG